MNWSTKGRHAVSMPATILFLGLVSCLLSNAQAQTLLTTHGNLLAATDQPVVGPSGAYFSPSIDLPVIADDGTVLFLANMYGGDVSGPGKSRALFRGTTAANLSMMIRSSDPAPGLAGLTLVNTAGSSGIQGGSRLTPDGRTFWSSYLSGPGVASNNDTAFFGGFPGSLAPIVREGDPAPGTTGAVFFGDRVTSTQFTALNRNGAVLFQSTLSGGDVVGVTNNEGLFTGTAGALSMVVRKGATVLPGPVTASSFPPNSQLSINSSGQVLYSLTLAGAGVTAANNASLWLYTPGLGNTLLVREGQLAPGTASATFSSSFDVWSPGLSIDGLNNSGQYVMTADLQGGDVVAGANDRALYVGSASGGLTMVARRGDPAPGTDALFGGFSNTCINSAGALLTVGLLMGGTSTATNSAAVYLATPTGIPATPYAWSLVNRAGDPAPGTQGAFFGPSFNNGGLGFNDSGQAVIKSEIRGGDQMFAVNDNGLFAWDPVKGLFLIARQGDQLQVAPGLFLAVSGFGYQSAGNTDGSTLALSKTGKLAMNVGWFDGGAGAVTLDLGCYPVYYPDADHDGFGDASSTNGVCSNASPPAGYVPNHTDCNDANIAVNKTWYLDADGDGYGNASVSICDDATPPAGYVQYGTDCNVTDPTIHPDRSDDSCDGVDQNCNNANDEGYQPHQSYCGVGACASMGVATCENGVVIDTCVPDSGSASPETCNGIDDNCDGTVDNVAVPTGTPSVTLSRISGGAASLSWGFVSGATGYDVTRGSLVTLRSSLGNYTTATTNCLGNDLAGTTISDLQSPAVGQGFWYVLRAVNCGGNASYDSVSPDQVGSRDAEIAASGVACP